MAEKEMMYICCFNGFFCGKIIAKCNVGNAVHFNNTTSIHKLEI